MELPRCFYRVIYSFFLGRLFPEQSFKSGRRRAISYRLASFLRLRINCCPHHFKNGGQTQDSSGSCLYVNSLADIDAEVPQSLIKDIIEAITKNHVQAIEYPPHPFFLNTESPAHVFWRGHQPPFLRRLFYAYNSILACISKDAIFFCFPLFYPCFLNFCYSCVTRVTNCSHLGFK